MNDGEYCRKHEFYKQRFPGILFTIDIDIEKLDDILLEENTIKLNIDYPCTYKKPGMGISVNEQTCPTLVRVTTLRTDQGTESRCTTKMDWDNTLFIFTYKNTKNITIKDCIQLLVDIQYTPCDGHHFLEAFDFKYDNEQGVYFDVHFGS